MKRRRVLPIAPEWSFAIEAESIGETPREVAIEAGPAERAALARRLGLLDLPTLRAQISLIRDGRSVHVSGLVEAEVVQACVITLTPVPAKVSEEFEAWYADPEATLSFAKARQERDRRIGAEDTPVLDEREDPEPTVDGLIDLGELAVQYLSLALDPYPRAPEAKGQEEPAKLETESSPLRKSPFAALGHWKFTKNREGETEQ